MDENEHGLAITQKVEDMMLYAYPALAQFPKSEKFALVADIKRNMDCLLELCIEMECRIYKKTTLQNLDAAQKKLKAYIRLAMKLEFLPMRKYIIWSEKLVEIGKMVGGLQKAVSKPAQHRE